eukprot:5449171-Pyramimonas_sp.AAC.1
MEVSSIFGQLVYRVVRRPLPVGGAPCLYVSGRGVPERLVHLQIGCLEVPPDATPQVRPLVVGAGAAPRPCLD